jgi:hypothetical protein
MNWITTNIRLPENVYFALKMQAARERKSIAAVIREQLGAADRHVSRVNGTAALVEFARSAKNHPWDAPKDFATGHDAYFITAWEDEAKSNL